MKFALEIDLNMKEIIKKWLYRAGFLIILFCSVVSCVNSFNKGVEYEVLEDIKEMKMSMDCVFHHIDSIEETLHDYLYYE